MQLYYPISRTARTEAKIGMIFCTICPQNYESENVKCIRFRNRRRVKYYHSMEQNRIIAIRRKTAGTQSLEAKARKCQVRPATGDSFDLLSKENE